MKTEKIIGILLILGALGVLVPYIALSLIFDYPGILRLDTAEILFRFHKGGQPLVWTWWAFGILGLPLLGAYILLGQMLENKFKYVRLATTIGVVGLMIQMVGLLRWTFVVPILAKDYMEGNDIVKEAAIIGFQIIHQYGGVILGEHLGQLFTIIWTAIMSYTFYKLKSFPNWVVGLGYISSFVYLMAQSELFATVIQLFTVIPRAGFLGSSLWIIWLLTIGTKMFKVKIE